MWTRRVRRTVVLEPVVKKAGVSEFMAMKTTLFLAGGLAAMALFSGCETVPPGVERGPNGTIAYEVSVESSPPGATIEANGQNVGQAPLKLKIFGDKDGTFHDFGSY